MERPDIGDYEFYDPQSMQEYAYEMEKYVDYLEGKLEMADDSLRAFVEYGD